jgi:homoserine kinase
VRPVADVVPVVFVPATPLSTEVARGLLPASVPHADAAFTAGRAGLLVAALTAPMPPADRRDLLLAATEERLHQRYRVSAMPASAELIARLRAAGVAAVVSGAGPTVLAFLVAGDPSGNTADAALVELVDEAWLTRRPPVDTRGVQVIRATRTNSWDPGRGESTKEC